jgi:MoaA/NifB/PqqE/SkfB family radical SAM enzyme
MIQIEVTTSCNLSCSYCFRNSQGRDIDPSIVEKISSCDSEFVLYGFGEPLSNRNINKIIRMLDGKITLSTNGIADIDEITSHVDRIGFSIDSLNESYLRTTRKGSDLGKILGNIEKANSKGFIEVVITRDNFNDVEELIKLAGNFGIDLILTNVVPPSREFYRRVLYFEPSKRVLELAGFLDGNDLEEDFIVKVIKDCSRGKGRYLERYMEIHRIAHEEGLQVNLLSMIESIERIQIAIQAEKRMRYFEEMAKDYGIKIDSPEFFGDAKNRECPYKNSIFLKADGRVSSCMILSRNHIEFVNNHGREVEEFIAGDLNYQEFDEVKESMHWFDERREDMENFPWCADCPHVSGCWYIARNEDCYINNPSCGECLYSTGIAKCLF